MYKDLFGTVGKSRDDLRSTDKVIQIEKDKQVERQTMKLDQEKDRKNLINSTSDLDISILNLSDDGQEDQPNEPGKISKKKRQAFKDNLILGPIDKYVKYNIFPYKFMVHICLLFLTMWEVLLNITPQTAYEAELRLTLNNLFLSTDPSSFEPPGIDTVIFLYDIGEFREFVD